MGMLACWKFPLGYDTLTQISLHSQRLAISPKFRIWKHYENTPMQYTAIFPGTAVKMKFFS